MRAKERNEYLSAADPILPRADHEAFAAQDGEAYLTQHLSDMSRRQLSRVDLRFGPWSWQTVVQHFLFARDDVRCDVFVSSRAIPWKKAVK